LVVAGVIGGAAFVQASPSGLNNTPTADTCSPETLVLQTWTGLGYDRKPDEWVGTKYGLFNGPTIGAAEIGVDWKTNGDPEKQPVFQGKYAIGAAANGPQLGVGIANVSQDKELNGNPMPYSVLSYDIKGWLRVHAGYGFQNDNNGAFGGLDRTFTLGSVNLMLCGDITQTNDRKDALLAPGIKISPSDAFKMDGVVGAVIKNMAFETWVNFPSTGAGESYVLKLDYAVHF
jgi:hypothetical protein